MILRREKVMKLKLFKIVDETVELFNQSYNRYNEIEEYVNNFLHDVVGANEKYIGTTSRVKSDVSLRNKIVKRKYYLEFDNAQDIIDNLSDVIGVTIECRFKEDEAAIYSLLEENFNLPDSGYAQSKTDPSIFMNFSMKQPQIQNNGFDIYRIDGYFINNDVKTNFELQIKSLINTFWSGIEHEVIYKNNNYLLFDSFLKDLLLSVKSNLDVIDSQLTQIYTEMTYKGNDSLGMDGTNFKAFLGKEINNIFANKLKETSQIEIDIKKISALLSHYLYLDDFVTSDYPQLIMLNYFEKLDLLSKTDMDFTRSINIEKDNDHLSVFHHIFGNYCYEVINIDFDWHVLFAMLLMLKDADATLKFNGFISFIEDLIFEPRWFQNIIAQINTNVKLPGLHDDVIRIVAQVLVDQNSVEVIYEENLYNVMVVVRTFMNDLLKKSKSYDSLIINSDYDLLIYNLYKVFN